MNLSLDGLTKTTKTTKEELIAQRISKRAAKKSEIREKAESYKIAGDLLYESKNYKAAHTRYLEAIRLLDNVPEYYISLAAAYRKLTWYEEAAYAATRALSIDPKNLEARYVRGVARLEQRLLQAAQIDFETVLEHDPTHLRALAAMTEVRQFLSGFEDMKRENAIVDFGFPNWDYEALEVASVSDSSDCQHVGNGVPCRFYNHDGCGKGSQCPYSHAPDEKSVRDDLGKNVCIYHILDSCKFGLSRCVYSHSKEALPTRGWWNSPEKVAKVKEVLEVAEKNARKQRQAEVDKWKAYMTELRVDARARQASEKQKAKAKEHVEPPLKSADAEKKKEDVERKNENVDKKKEDMKNEVEQVKEIVEGKTEVKEKTTAGAPVNSTPASRKPKARGKKTVVEPQAAQQKELEGSANGDNSKTPAPKRRFHKHYRRKTPKTGGAQSSAIMGEGSTPSV